MTICGTVAIYAWCTAGRLVFYLDLSLLAFHNRFRLDTRDIVICQSHPRKKYQSLDPLRPPNYRLQAGTNMQPKILRQCTNQLC